MFPERVNVVAAMVLSTMSFSSPPVPARSADTVFDAVSGKMNLVFAVAVPVIVPLLTDKVPVAAGELNASVPVPER